MLRLLPTPLAAVIALAAFAPAAPAEAQVVRATRIAMPAAKAVDPEIIVYDDEPPADDGAAMEPGDFPPDGAPGAAGASEALAPDEIAELKELWERLDEPGREEMRAYYADLGVNLDVALGFAAEKSAAMQRGQAIAGTMRDMDFARKPEAVLAARARLGFGAVAQPNADTAQPMDIARWIHLQIMAGEWQAFATFLAGRPETESDPIYAAVLQSLNRGDAGLLPEEVLAIADASPKDFKPWQITSLGRMLQQASAKHSTGSMLASIRAGTRYFGTASDAARRRTVEFLAGGGLLAEAYGFLPPLAEAEAKGDGAQLIVHARYKLDLAEKAGDSPEGEAHRIEAFRILTGATLLPSETVDRRREALRLAIGQMNLVPKKQVAPWLAEVFASPALGPAALEQIALSASKIGDMGASEELRAKALLNMKESIDVLLARDDVDGAALRVPLRMVTTALVAEMERAIGDRGQQQFIGRDAQLLYRAIPSEKWLASLEPSLATRARKAAIALATIADETDQALGLLDKAIEASPDEAAGFSDHFLANWVGRLRPEVEYPEEMMMFFSFYRDAMPMAPLTRGRQRRNLDRLDALVARLREAGVEPRALPSIVPAFQACHARTEVYERRDIERVFGPFAQMPPESAVRLAATMAGSLNGDWRSRDALKAAGTKRSDSEIAQLVDRGYGVAIELVDSAVRQRPEAWSLAGLHASLTYDRLQYQQSLKTAQDPVQANEYRKAAFQAFADAAASYVAALTRGDTRDDLDVHLRWFGAAMGTAELNFLRPEDLPKEGTLQDDQVDLVRKSLQTLEPEAYDRHIAGFAAALEGAVQRAAPEVKPRFVRHALRVIGNHPAGASMRAMEELYRDLVKDEIKLRLAVDGTDKVGVNRPFGALLSLRFTNSVDRETGGFAKYLQNGVYGRVGNQFRQMNYRDELEKTVRGAFGKDFEVDAIGFFDPFMPPRGIVEEGQDGWLEKPLAYIVLTRKDPAIDTVPAVVMDMQFTDQTGPVTLAVPSNTPLLATGEESTPRRVADLEVTQLVDVRAVNDEAPGGGEAGSAADPRAVTLEVRMRGKGVLPELREVLAGLDAPLAGYALAKDGITSDPTVILSSADASMSPFLMMQGSSKEPKDGYPEPDADGMYRLPVERSFKVTYVPTGASVGSDFALPTLAAGVEAKLESRFYDDLDIMPTTASTVPVDAQTWTTGRLAGAGLAAVALVAIGIFTARRRRPAPVAPAAPWTPARLTPLGVVTSLRRLESTRASALPPDLAKALRDEIVTLELKYFGPRGGVADSAEAELREVIARWERQAR